jgi:hypothetical protein
MLFVTQVIEILLEARLLVEIHLICQQYTLLDYQRKLAPHH